MSQKVSDGNIMTREGKVCAYIQSNGKIGNKAVQDLLDVKETVARNLLNKMIESGAINGGGKIGMVQTNTTFYG
ncbi:hypothetical protein KQI58_20470 [Enterococcus raffinosus]|uniref:hypothetical protein n=1 Tax=Enterococcus raffinosus TaxID=71452 RepID=UPI001C0FE6A1|nr:hypothetical protein [Enterococcus raffinosus]MBU5363401.1 hypothetical protein [Enterococcus raffinosus]